MQKKVTKFIFTDAGSIASKMASRRQSLDSQLSEAQGQFQYSDDEDADQEYVDLPNMIGGGASGSGRGKRRRKRKKKRKSHKNKVLPVLAPVTREMAAAAYGGGRRRRNRRSSKSSLGSRASAQGVDINVERNSIDAVSMDSYSHQGSLDNATLPNPPKGLTTNFAIFTASTYAGEMKTQIDNENEMNNIPHGSMRGHTNSRRMRQASSSNSMQGGERRRTSSQSASRQGSASGSQRRNASVDINNSRHGSASSMQRRNAAIEMSSNVRQGSASSYRHNSRQGSASSYHHRDNSYEMNARMNCRQNSATSHGSRGTRQSSATSNRSMTRQLPGETEVVEIYDDYISQGSLD